MEEFQTLLRVKPLMCPKTAYSLVSECDGMFSGEAGELASGANKHRVGLGGKLTEAAGGSTTGQGIPGLLTIASLVLVGVRVQVV